MGDRETRGERLGLALGELREGVLRPGDEPLLRRFALHELLRLLRIVRRLPLHLEVLDDVFGCLDDDRPAIVETLPAGAARDLLEIANGEDRRLLAVEFAE